MGFYKEGQGVSRKNSKKKLLKSKFWFKNNDDVENCRNFKGFGNIYIYIYIYIYIINTVMMSRNFFFK